MSTMKVTVEKLTVHEHPNADALEQAQVGAYRAVVPKGVYGSGEYALYIPEQAVLPPELITELGLDGRLAGKTKDRVKAVRLRGAISQGIVCRPKALDGIEWQDAYADSTDFAESLGIHKYVPPIPPSMAGTAFPAPDLIRWIDIENLRRYPDIFVGGEPVTATEKIHGTACLATYVPHEELLVSSKGVGASLLALEHDPTNLYWRAVTQFNVRAAAVEIADDWHAEKVGIFGEVFGSGVQDLGYGASASHNDTLGYRVFDIVVVRHGEKIWLSQDVLKDHGLLYDLPVVPRLYEGPFDFSALEQAAAGSETLTGASAHVREGVVVRPVVERYSEVLGGRAIAKLINPDYLLRKGGTEFE